MFQNAAEIRQLGTPVVAVFRTALGRDPDVFELGSFVQSMRQQRSFIALATRLVATAEFRAQHGDARPGDLLNALCANAFGPEAAGGAVRSAAERAETAAEMVAAVAGAALAMERVPLLPGLFPGASPDDPVAYSLWVDEYDQPRSFAATSVTEPLITLAMISGDTEAEAAQRTVKSLGAQTYKRWELCLAAHTRSPWARELIEQLPAEEARVRLVPAEGLSAALRAGTGALFGVLAPGDRLAAEALHDVAAGFAAYPETLLLFTDEDVEDESGRHSPRFKPAFSPEALFGGDAIGQLAVYRMDLLAEIGVPDGADAIRGLACRAAGLVAPHQVAHIPKVLCHRGRVPAPLAREMRRAPLPASPPLVTIVIPTKDRPDLLEACAKGVLERTDYERLECIIVDNGSTDPAALALQAELERRPDVRLLRQPGAFNFAALNNAAAAVAPEGLLLLLNNDTEVQHPDWLDNMVRYATRPGVGIVGARLLYPDNTVQHAGMLLGPGGRATHVGRGASPADPGYFGQLACTRDLSAVTAACLLISTDTWQLVGGMDERLAVTWNDVDLCLRVRQAGLRVLWTPDATLLHRESVSRGVESADPEKLARFRAEQAIVLARWGDAIERDPFLNPNLVVLESGGLALTRPRNRGPVAMLPAAVSTDPSTKVPSHC